MTTIADVARQAAVGLATVSWLINGSPQVRETTRAPVPSTIELRE